MSAAKELDDMMFDIDPFKFGLCNDFVLVQVVRDSAYEPGNWPPCGALQGKFVAPTSSLGNGYDPAL